MRPHCILIALPTLLLILSIFSCFCSIFKYFRRGWWWIHTWIWALGFFYCTQEIICCWRLIHFLVNTHSIGSATSPTMYVFFEVIHFFLPLLISVLLWSGFLVLVIISTYSVLILTSSFNLQVFLNLNIYFQ